MNAAGNEGVPIGRLQIRNGVVRSADDVAIDLLGIDPTGTALAEAFRADDRPVLADCLGGDLARTVAIDCRPSAGVEWVRCWLNPVASGVEVTVVDRTGDRRADVLASFDSAMAHDLRNPLNVLDGRLQLLEVESQHLGAIERATRGIADQIEALRALADAGSPLVGPDLIDLSTVVESAIEEATTEAATVDLPRERHVIGDRDRLRATVVELLENAREHGDAETVAISIDGATLNVSDDGSGPLDLDRIFEAGYTTDPDRPGYGLTRVDWTARAHGWTVGAEESAGGGLTVTLEIGDPLLTGE